MQERMCRLLLDKGADVDARNFWARAALQEAGWSVRYQIDRRATMELLLNQGPYLNAYDNNSWTALTDCGFYGDTDLAELLLANGAQIDGKPRKDDLAFESNPDLNLTGKTQDTSPAICARDLLICLLLDNGADIESKNKDGKTMAVLALMPNVGLYWTS